MAILTKHKPVSSHFGMNSKEYDDEGRVITLEYQSFFLITVYMPNAGVRLNRLSYKLQFEKEFLKFLMELKEKKKNLIVTGDFNVAYSKLDTYEEMDDQEPGYSLEERMSFRNYLNGGFKDSFRLCRPDATYFSMWAENNDFGFFVPSASYWRRMNYILLNDDKDFLSCIRDSNVLFNMENGSDHLPVVLELNKNIV